MQTNDKSLTDLMKSIQEGKTQLPDFQRGWVWDDDRIRGLIASVTRNFPIGATMFLQYGNEDVRFKCRPVEGSPATNVTPETLILDGQQRLTSLYNAFYTEVPVRTRTAKNKEIYRHYYIDIEKAVDPNADRLEAIVSVPENKKITSNFGHNLLLDLSTREKEYENKHFPLNIILNLAEVMKWSSGYSAFHANDAETIKKWGAFTETILSPTAQYKIPVILLEKDTPKEAVCQVFENVNTGGVSLTVFELVTAIFAMNDFELRKDWDTRQSKYFSGDVLSIVSAPDFLTACTLFSTYQKGGTVSAKKNDVLKLSLNDYKSCADLVSKGFKEAEKILSEECVFSAKDLPYSTQLIPLAVICALLIENHEIKTSIVRNKVKQWYWCGVFGELYGGAFNSRFVNDVVDVLAWVKGEGAAPKTIQEAYFNPTRLLGLQSRLSAAYNGVMALIYKNDCKDFLSSNKMDLALYQSEKIDIHHIFPKDYCVSKGYPSAKWNSVVNKTPISYYTNRAIGGVAPSEYLAKISSNVKKGVSETELDANLESHWIDPKLARSNDFDKYFVERAKKILDAIEKAMGKPISGRDSEEVVDQFGTSLK